MDRRRRAWCARAAPIRQFDRTGSASIVNDSREQQGRSPQRRHRRSRRRRSRAATRSSTSNPTTRRRSCRRRTASGSRSPSAGTRISHRSRIPDVPIDLGPSISGYPVARISRDAGFYLHWSGDSSKVLLVDGAGALLARSRRAPSGSSTRTWRSPTSRKPRACQSVSPPRATRPTARSRSSGRGSLPPAGDHGDRERHHRRRRQPHRPAIGPASRFVFRRARSASTPPARPSCPASSTCTDMSAGKGTASSRRRTGRFAANLAFGVTTTHDPSNDTETVFSNAELIRAGHEARPAAVLDRHDPLRRRNAVQGGRRQL